MRNFGAGIIAMLCLVAIAGCTTNKSIANITTSSNKMQLAVGTINDSAGTLGIGGVSLNVVTTFRNSLGNSAFIHPGFYTLTGPSGTIVTPNPSNPCDQLFVYGDLPIGCEADSIGDAIVGVPPAYTPPSSVLGYPMGFIQTGAAASAGAYSVSTIVTVNGQNVTYTANATLSPIVMANATGVTSFASDGKGGGTFTIGNPLKAKLKLHHHGFVPVSEYLILVSNSVISSSPLIVAAVETTSTTATIVGTGDCSSSVGGIPIPCGGNNAYVIDADYPLVEDGPPASHAQTPQLDGPNGSADISVSPIAGITE
ncbi:MAG TPA: hypothetical protein VFO25_07380 [Candidatus Eremiobacteraceae bacterium]|nr:hypothetical protein [Candidatus Eremiobacteraceae bacterium]